MPSEDFHDRNHSQLMKRTYSFLYLVDWGNGFLGEYDEDFTQIFNTPQRIVFDDLKRLGVRNVMIITPKELDELRGYHKPSMQEFFGI